ncbi:MAG: hypothetical protein K2Y21_16035 [Phycisphaerales bacterium]|nr:hypothetical protein [Phycisphaerales bacterium]
MKAKSIMRALSIAIAVRAAGPAIATPYPGSSLRINGGSGGTSASYYWVYTDPITQ